MVMMLRGVELWDHTTHRIKMDRDEVFDEFPFIKSNIVKYERFKAWLVA
jgi:hypothetical protein